MAEKLYGLTERTAGQLRQLLGDGGAIGGGATSAPAARGNTWVKVTSGTPTSGWYPGVVSLDTNGTFTDLTAAVKVASADGTALVNGNRYQCTRTGDDSAGARFRTVVAAATAITWNRSAPPGSGPFSGSSGVWTNTGTSVVLSTPGLYQLMMEATGFALVTALGATSSNCSTLLARLDDGQGAAFGIRGTTGVVVCGTVANGMYVWGTHTATVLYTVPAATTRTITLQVCYNQQLGGTSVLGLSTSLPSDAAAIWWAKIG